MNLALWMGADTGNTHSQTVVAKVEAHYCMKYHCMFKVPLCVSLFSRRERIVY